MFIFSCYAGLANIEINVLAPHHITTDNKGGFWLVMQRRKTLNTNKRSFAYVGLPIGLVLIQKYRVSIEAITETGFPCSSNQDTNKGARSSFGKSRLK